MSGVSLKLLYQVSGEYELAEYSVRLILNFICWSSKARTWLTLTTLQTLSSSVWYRVWYDIKNVNIIQYSMEIPRLNAKNVLKFVYVTFLFAVLFWLTVSVLCSYLFLHSVGQTICPTRFLVVLVVPWLQSLSRSIYCTSKAGVQTVAV